MKEIFIEGTTLPQAYHKALIALEDEGTILDCAAYNQLQKEVSMTVSVTNPLQEPRISQLLIGGFEELQQYEMEVLDGILNFRIGNGWDYTYNARFKDQIPFIIRELKRDPSSRRAAVMVRTEDDIDSNDPACLQHLQYFIREDKLHCKVLFRSNDLPEAFFFNAWAFIRLQERIAKDLDMEVGSYTHRSNSMHCYEKDFVLLKSYSDAAKQSVSIDDLTYEYKDFWENIMKDTIPDILKKVETLKNN